MKGNNHWKQKGRRAGQKLAGAGPGAEDDACIISRDGRDWFARALAEDAACHFGVPQERSEAFQQGYAEAVLEWIERLQRREALEEGRLGVA